MKNKKLLFALIPVAIIVLMLVIGLVFIGVNGSPQNIFKNSVKMIFALTDKVEDSHKTVKGTFKLSADIESDDESIQELNAILDELSVVLNMEVDTQELVVNENVNITYEDETLLNGSLIVQDEKGYIYLPDWLDKYIELPTDELDLSDMKESYARMETIDQEALLDAIEEELINIISEQELTKENVIVVLDGQEVKAKASTLSLKNEQISTFFRTFLGNLKNNQKFQAALGDLKDEAIQALDDMTPEMESVEDTELTFTIFTKGLFNEIVGVSAKAINSYYGQTIGLDLVIHNENKYEVVSYNIYDEEREELAKFIIEDKKENANKGTVTATITADGEEFILVCNYEKQNNQITFDAHTEIEEIGLRFAGSITENGNNYKGNLTISVEEESFGTASINCDYDITYDAEISKVDTQNSALPDELSDEEQEELVTNFQESTLYQLLDYMNLIDDSLLGTVEIPEVTLGNYTVRYNLPDGFEPSQYNLPDDKLYIDDDNNSVIVCVKYNTINNYMNNLENSYYLTSGVYSNQQISDVREYTANGKVYKYRTISYEDSFANSYLNLFFAYELGDSYIYVVEIEAENGDMTMETVNNFLDVTVE